MVPRTESVPKFLVLENCRTSKCERCGHGVTMTLGTARILDSDTDAELVCTKCAKGMKVRAFGYSDEQLDEIREIGERFERRN